MDKTIVAIATPPGQGAIAVLRMSGRQTFEIADSIIKLKNTKKLIKNMPGYTAAYGQVMEDNLVIDDVVILVFRAPNSYTGEDSVEISCHGGEWISKRVLQVCLNAGAEMAAAGEFTKRAFLNDKLSLSQAEGVIELITANSIQEAASASAMLQGEENYSLNRIKSELMAQLVHLSAWMDYPEEEVEEVEEHKFLSKIESCRLEIDEILAVYDDVHRMKRGIKAVIFGNPNVGKSTIFNVLLGQDRAITTSIPGTTRDILKDELYLQGYPLFLYDTAGLRISHDPIEAEGIRRTSQELEAADILLAVFDASQKIDIDHLFEHANNQIPKIGIFNKNDLTNYFDLNDPKYKQFFDQVVCVSAKENPQQACKAIKDAMIQVLNLKNIDPNYKLLLNTRRHKALINARNELYDMQTEAKMGLIYDIARENLENALQSFYVLSGDDPTEEMIEEIFKTFCVGK